MKSQKICVSLIMVFLLMTAGQAFSSGFEKIHENYRIRSGKKLKVYIEIDAGNVQLFRSDESRTIVISGQINKEYDKLDVDYDQRLREFSITLDRNRWLKSVSNDEASIIEIGLPDDVILDIRSKIKAGKAELDLGGLKLRNFELRNLAGEAEVDFAEPNKIEMDLLAVNVKIGETTLRRLGNARFADANINSGIGELYVDLSGEGSKSCRVEIDLDIGSSSIYLPRDLGIKLKSSTMGFLTQSSLDSEFEKKGRYYYSKNYNSAKRTMYVVIHTGIGELTVNFR